LRDFDPLRQARHGISDRTVGLPDFEARMDDVHDLVAGSGLEFEDRGERELKGIEGVRRLYATRS
jgi:hypothetical protein